MVDVFVLLLELLLENKMYAIFNINSQIDISCPRHNVFGNFVEIQVLAG